MPVNDPLDLVWLATARRVGLAVRRRPDVFASTDGQGTLFLGDRASLDADDCLAQMVLHELCHALVNGPAAWSRPDWGFPPMDGLDPLEYPALRVQKALASRYGLARLLATTTSGRRYWDQITDPFAPLDPSPTEADAAARAWEGWIQAEQGPLSIPLHAALRATAAIVGIARGYDPSNTTLAS